MSFKKNLHDLITNINVGFHNKSIQIKHKYNKNLEKILYLLIQEGLIYGFQKKKDSFLIFLKVTKDTIIPPKLKSKSKISKQVFIKKKSLESVQYKNPSELQIISTHKGIFVSKSTNYQGGEFLFAIN